MKNNLKAMRKLKQMTQKEVAYLCKISFRTYQNYEVHKQIPSVAVALALANVFDSTVEKIFYLE